MCLIQRLVPFMLGCEDIFSRRRFWVPTPLKPRFPFWLEILAITLSMPALNAQGAVKQMTSASLFEDVRVDEDELQK